MSLQKPAKAEVPNGVIKTVCLWLQALPPQERSILAVVTTDLSNLAKIVDKINEKVLTTIIPVVTTENTAVKKVDALIDEILTSHLSCRTPNLKATNTKSLLHISRGRSPTTLF